jgi:hypothetical protein
MTKRYRARRAAQAGYVRGLIVGRKAERPEYVH